MITIDSDHGRRLRIARWMTTRANQMTTVHPNNGRDQYTRVTTKPIAVKDAANRTMPNARPYRGRGAELAHERALR
jgi:hypothetical protein